MARPLSSRTLLTVFVVAPLLGCAAKPPERFIVLRPPLPEQRLVHRVAPRRAPVPAALANAPSAPLASTPAAAGLPASVSASADKPAGADKPAAAAAPALTPDQKENLFEAFDNFLAQTGRPQ